VSASQPRTPSGLVELLRLLTVLFFAGVGFEAARAFGRPGRALGPFGFVAVGVIVGCGVGYVLGGIVGRSAAVAATRTEVALREVTADTLVAGAVGTVAGLVGAAAVAWPVFLLRQPFVSVPLFGVVVLLAGYLGCRVAVGRREELLGALGPRGGLPRRPVATAALPRLVDSSVAIDGRILQVVEAGFLHGRMLVTEPVLAELQALADAGDDTRRARGRRGLGTLEALRRLPGVTVEVVPDGCPQVPAVDAKLVRTALDTGAALLTLDTNLARAATLAGAAVLNLHTLGLALRPPVLAGDEATVLLLRPGKEAGQAVGYLDDGTMVVVERARDRVGQEIAVRVTGVLTTANGRMVFAAPQGAAGAAAGGAAGAAAGGAQGDGPIRLAGRPG
jgi:uncharacterized protein YacL